MSDARRGRRDPPPSQASTEEALPARLAGLDPPRRKLMREFLNEVVVCYDPDVVHDFLQWRGDPTLSSILQLAASMSPEMREQLLFAAEELYSGDSQLH
ncbi:MAG: hypothetical protein AAGB18_05730 [Pseudomonadota bacterium]